MVNMVKCFEIVTNQRKDGHVCVCGSTERQANTGTQTTEALQPDC